jgi:hypothetical protein
LITGDSGGGLFILNGSQWQLAGINYAVEGPFSYTSSGPPFYAALFDRGGLYQLGNGGVWQLISENPAALKPSAFYATQVAARLTWLRSLIAEHEGRDPLPSLLVSAMPQGPYEVATDASVDETTQTIRVPASGAARFYRLTACQVLRFSSIAAAGNQVLLKYEPTAQP